MAGELAGLGEADGVGSGVVEVALPRATFETHGNPGIIYYHILYYILHYIVLHYILYIYIYIYNVS